MAKLPGSSDAVAAILRKPRFELEHNALVWFNMRRSRSIPTAPTKLPLILLPLLAWSRKKVS